MGGRRKRQGEGHCKCQRRDQLGKAASYHLCAPFVLMGSFRIRQVYPTWPACVQRVEESQKTCGKRVVELEREQQRPRIAPGALWRAGLGRNRRTPPRLLPL
jgi:hypothetical protein